MSENTEMINENDNKSKEIILIYKFQSYIRHKK